MYGPCIINSTLRRTLSSRIVIAALIYRLLDREGNDTAETSRRNNNYKYLIKKNIVRRPACITNNDNDSASTMTTAVIMNTRTLGLLL